MAPFFWVIVAIVIISTVVGAIAKMINSMNEMNAMKARPQVRGNGGAAGGGGGGGTTVRQSNSDMDRFLAEIDRLRKKNADAPAAPTQGQSAPVAPVVQPEKRPDRPRTRVVAELAEPAPRHVGVSRANDQGFGPPINPTATSGPRAGDLPMATVVTRPTGTGAPATRVTRIASRPRPVAKTEFAQNLTGLLNGGQGLAMAIVLQEILGPAKSKKR